MALVSIVFRGRVILADLYVVKTVNEKEEGQQS